MLVISLFVFVSYLRADNQMNFRHYLVEDGLSQNTVWCILQDSQGFMWFGTKDGLNRFDGNNFRIFRKSPGNINSIGNNFIRSMLEIDEVIWVGTDNGLYLYYPHKENFSRFDMTAQNGDMISSAVNSIVKDQENNIWIASFSQGLYRYDARNDILINYRHDPNILSSISSNIILTLFCDSYGDIWIGTINGGLNKFDKQNNAFTRYMSNDRSSSLGDTDVFSIFEDSEQNFWVGTWADGLKLMDREQGTFKHYRHKPGENSISHNTIRSILEIGKGKLLIATEMGLNILDPATGILSHLRYKIDNPASLSENAVYSLYSDKEGGLWAGTYFGGVNYSSPPLKPFEHYFPGTGPGAMKGKAVSEFLEDKYGNFWIGTEDNGLSYFDIRKKSFINFIPDPEKNSISYHNIHSLLIDNGELWIGTWTGGLDVMDLKTRTFRNYMPDPNDPNSLTSDCIYSIYRDNTGRIWIGTISGLSYYDREKDHFITVHEKGLAGIYIIDILQDNYGYIWFASYGEGVFRFDPRNSIWQNYRHSEKNPHSICHNKVISIFQDDTKRLWFGTEGGGISRYLYNEDRFVSFSEKDGLPNNVVYGILDDKSGNLWISTNYGLCRFDPETRNVKQYLRDDGLQSNQFNYKSSYKAGNGKLYFGGVNGFNSFYPDSLIDNSFIPPVKVTNFQLFNKNASINTDESPLQQSISKTSKIVLKHNQSVISFEFVALSFMAPQKNQYAYMMEGFDADWNYVGTQRRASYTNLPTGKYKFRVMGSNNDGKWNTDGVDIEIVVLPPFWRTNWAYGIYFLIFIGGILGFRHYFIRTIRNKHRKKLEQIQIAKEKEITQLKFDFFINIAHEIRTPLTLIRGPLENLLSDDINPEDRKLQLEIMDKNSLQLLNLVNHLLDFRKMENGNFMLKYSTINLKGLIEDVYQRFSPVANQKNISFTFQNEPGNYETLADPVAITNVLSNLLTNAFKFTRNEVDIHLSFYPNGSDVAEFFHIAVKDNGIGIPKSEQKKIFLPFYQIGANSKSTSIFSGTGLGLSYAKSLAELQKGEIDVESTQDSGTVMTFKLPNLQDNDSLLKLATSVNGEEIVMKTYPDLEQPSELSFNVSEVTSSHHSSITILIVDDNEDLLRFMQAALNSNYHIVTAYNGNEGIKIIKDKHIDLVISDIMMPVMDGREFCRLIKNDFVTSHIPVILLTAKTSIESKVEGLEFGADIYLDKPFSMDHLKAQISSILNNRDKILRKFSSEPFVGANVFAKNEADKSFLNKVTCAIENNMNVSDFSIDDMAVILSISRSGLQKKLKAITGLTPNEFINLVRLKKAASLLTDGEKRVNEVCYLTGFNSPSYFSRLFQQYFGILPKEFQKNIRSRDE